ncbi:alpha/beta-hydrolase [Pyrenochaeta sp. DS3sAY3a]|nr:alpha/beta-hydrolase [Pyrenochaeta sp. DS3sAY3a]
MSSPKQIVLIIGGGWHTTKSYEKLIALLEQHGFEVHVPSHPSMNQVRPPNADLETDSTHMRSYVENLLKDGREIIVVMHSYGGQVGTNALDGFGFEERAAKGLPGGILNLIYMTACALPEGLSMIDMVKHHGHEELMPLAFDFADDMTCLSRDPKTLLVGADSGLPDAEVEEYLSTLVRWNGKCMYDPLTTERAAWRDIRVTYIYTLKDMTIPHDYQKWLVDEMKKSGVEVQVVVVDSGHCPNLTATEEIFTIIRKVAIFESLEVAALQGQGTSKDTVKDAILNIGGEKS